MSTPSTPKTAAPFSFKGFEQNDMYRNPAELLTHDQPPISEAIKSAVVVVDANVLLVPYEVGKVATDEIRETYKSLSEANRLIIPGQSLREFIKHRTQNLADITSKLDGMISRANPQVFNESIPDLSGSAEYLASRELNKTFIAAGEALQKSLEKLKYQFLPSETGRDSVSTMYAATISGAVYDPAWSDGEKAAIFAESTARDKARYAPGFHDNGIGDLIIWKTIIKSAIPRRHCIFITEETKTDWWVKTKAGTFEPRPELIEEYRRASEGGGLYLMPLSRLLHHVGGTQVTVQAVAEAEETTTRERLKEEYNSALMQLDAAQNEYKEAEYLLLQATYPYTKGPENYGITGETERMQWYKNKESAAKASIDRHAAAKERVDATHQLFSEKRIAYFRSRHFESEPAESEKTI